MLRRIVVATRISVEFADQATGSNEGEWLAWFGGVSEGALGVFTGLVQMKSAFPSARSWR